MSSTYIIKSFKSVSINRTTIGLRDFDHMLFVFLFLFIRDVKKRRVTQKMLSATVSWSFFFTLLGSEDWKQEYERLVDNVPIVLTEILTEHSHQVLHVSFSNNGKMFATTSKDAYIKIWNSNHPAKLKYEYDMKTLCWKYTQFSQFNSTDTLILVSGIHFGSIHATSGEIAIFSVTDEFQLRCRVQNRPYDIFGCFYNENFVLSGDLRWLAHLVSKSTIVLNRTSQEIASERTPVTKDLYNFYNRNASSVRNLM